MHNPDVPLTTSNLIRLLDRHGDPPNRSYLVQWDVTPLQLTWFWAEDLWNVRYLMDRVDAWIRSGCKQNVMKYCKRFKGGRASESGLCAMEAFRSVCYDVGRPGLVTMDHWNRFENLFPDDVAYGVKKADMAKFLEFLRSQDVPLDYNAMFRPKLKQAINSVKELAKYAQTLNPGRYLTCAGQHDVEHCFVLRVGIPDPKWETSLTVLNYFKDGADPPCSSEPLSNLLWINNVSYIVPSAVDDNFTCRHGKRKTKTQRAREKREKKKLQEMKELHI